MAEDLQNEIREIAEKISGCRFVSLVGYDGITIAQHITEADFDVSVYDAELSSIMLASKEVKGSLTLGKEEELVWLTENSFFIIRSIGEDFFIYCCLKSTGSNPGAARIELNRAKKTIHKILYSDA